MTLCQHCVNKDARNSQRKVSKLRSKYPIGLFILCWQALAIRSNCLVPLLASLELVPTDFTTKCYKNKCVLAVVSLSAIKLGKSCWVIETMIWAVLVSKSSLTVVFLKVLTYCQQRQHLQMSHQYLQSAF